MSRHENGADPVGDFVDGLVDGMVTGYVLLVTFIDRDGDTSYYGDTMQGQTAPASLGIIEAMAAIEKARVVRHHFGDER